MGRWPSQGRHTLQLTMEVLEHMDEFMTDQFAAHLISHRPLFKGDRAEPARRGTVGGVFAGELRLAGDHGDTESPALREQTVPQAWILIAAGQGSRWRLRIIRADSLGLLSP